MLTPKALFLSFDKKLPSASMYWL